MNAVTDNGTNDNGDRGGPPVVGDFDADGFPEIGVAGATRVRIFDLDCPDGCNGETEKWVRWSQPSTTTDRRFLLLLVFNIPRAFRTISLKSIFSA